MAEADGLTAALLEAAPDAMLAVDEGGRVILVNEQAERLFGAPREALQGRALDALLAISPTSAGLPFPVPPARPASPRAVELFARRGDGTWVPAEVSLATTEVGAHRVSVAIVRDLTERRRRESDLVFRSSHDVLTGLANRRAFDEALARLDALGPHPVGVLMVDVDDLKLVNDGHGHAAGDAVLRRVAHVLRETFRADDVVARLGGDEFAVLTAGRDARSVQRLARRLLEAVQRHNQAHDGVALKLSIGVAVADQGGALGAALLDADARMYSMKRRHHGG